MAAKNDEGVMAILEMDPVDLLLNSQSVEDLIRKHLQVYKERSEQLQQRSDRRELESRKLFDEAEELRTRNSGLQHENGILRRNVTQLDRRYRTILRDRDEEIRRLRTELEKWRSSRREGVSTHRDNQELSRHPSHLKEPHRHDPAHVAPLYGHPAHVHRDYGQVAATGHGTSHTENHGHVPPVHKDDPLEPKSGYPALHGDKNVLPTMDHSPLHTDEHQSQPGIFPPNRKDQVPAHGLETCHSTVRTGQKNVLRNSESAGNENICVHESPSGITAVHIDNHQNANVGTCMEQSDTSTAELAHTMDALVYQRVSHNHTSSTMSEHSSHNTSGTLPLQQTDMLVAPVTEQLHTGNNNAQLIGKTECVIDFLKNSAAEEYLEERKRRLSTCSSDNGEFPVAPSVLVSEKGKYSKDSTDNAHESMALSADKPPNQTVNAEVLTSLNSPTPEIAENKTVVEAESGTNNTSSELTPTAPSQSDVAEKFTVDAEHVTSKKPVTIVSHVVSPKISNTKPSIHSKSKHHDPSGKDTPSKGKKRRRDSEPELVPKKLKTLTLQDYQRREHRTSSTECQSSEVDSDAGMLMPIRGTSADLMQTANQTRALTGKSVEQGHQNRVSDIKEKEVEKKPEEMTDCDIPKKISAKKKKKNSRDNADKKNGESTAAPVQLTDLERMRAYSGIECRREVCQKISEKEARQRRNHLLQKTASGSGKEECHGGKSLVANDMLHLAMEVEQKDLVGSNSSEEESTPQNKTLKEPVVASSVSPEKQKTDSSEPCVANIEMNEKCLVDNVTQKMPSLKETVVPDKDLPPQEESMSENVSNILSTLKMESLITKSGEYSLPEPRITKPLSLHSLDNCVPLKAISNMSDCVKTSKEALSSDVKNIMHMLHQQTGKVTAREVTQAPVMHMLHEKTGKKVAAREVIQAPVEKNILTRSPAWSLQRNGKHQDNPSAMVFRHMRPRGQQFPSPIPRRSHVPSRPTSNTVKAAQKVTRLARVTYDKQRDPRLGTGSPTGTNIAIKEITLPRKKNHCMNTGVSISLPTPKEISDALMSDVNEDNEPDKDLVKGSEKVRKYDNKMSLFSSLFGTDEIDEITVDQPVKLKQADKQEKKKQTRKTDTQKHIKGNIVTTPSKLSDNIVNVEYNPNVSDTVKKPLSSYKIPKKKDGERSHIEEDLAGSQTIHHVTKHKNDVEKLCKDHTEEMQNPNLSEHFHHKVNSCAGNKIADGNDERKSDASNVYPHADMAVLGTFGVDNPRNEPTCTGDDYEGLMNYAVGFTPAYTADSAKSLSDNLDNSLLGDDVTPFSFDKQDVDHDSTGSLHINSSQPSHPDSDDKYSEKEGSNKKENIADSDDSETDCYFDDDEMAKVSVLVKPTDMNESLKENDPDPQKSEELDTDVDIIDDPTLDIEQSCMVKDKELDSVLLSSGDSQIEQGSEDTDVDILGGDHGNLNNASIDPTFVSVVVRRTDFTQLSALASLAASTNAMKPEKDEANMKFESSKVEENEISKKITDDVSKTSGMLGLDMSDSSDEETLQDSMIDTQSNKANWVENSEKVTVEDTQDKHENQTKKISEAQETVAQVTCDDVDVGHSETPENEQVTSEVSVSESESDSENDADDSFMSSNSEDDNVESSDICSPRKFYCLSEKAGSPSCQLNLPEKEPVSMDQDMLIDDGEMLQLHPVGGYADLGLDEATNDEQALNMAISRSTKSLRSESIEHSESIEEGELSESLSPKKDLRIHLRSKKKGHERTSADRDSCPGDRDSSDTRQESRSSRRDSFSARASSVRRGTRHRSRSRGRRPHSRGHERRVSRSPPHSRSRPIRSSRSSRNVREKSNHRNSLIKRGHHDSPSRELRTNAR